MAFDAHTGDLTTEQRWKRVGVQAGIGLTSDAAGAGAAARVAPLCSFGAVGCAAALGVGGAASAMTDIMLNVGVDTLTDNSSFAEEQLGDWQ